MRRLGSVVLLTLCLLGAAFGAPGRQVPGATAADLAPLPAVQADSLVDSYGVGIHLAFLDTPYQDATAVAAALADLGVRHVRDDLYMANPRQYAGIRTVAAKGVGFDLIMGNPSSRDSAAAYVDTVATQFPRGVVESVEGSNEWDLFSGGDPQWSVNLLSRQRELYEAARSNPATSDLPVLSPALAFKWNYAAAGDLSQYADYANAHMYPGGFKPSNEISQITSAVRASVPGKPLVTTEAGYHNALNTTNGHLPVPEDVAGAYTPRVLLEHYLRGEKRVYTYELIDEFADPALTDPEAHFGLLRRDLSPKPAYTAMKNLLGLLTDPGPPFTTSALPVKVTGYPSDGKYVLTQKRNGQYVLLLWRDVSLYDPITHTPQAVLPTNVTLQLAKSMDVTVYRPSQGATSVSRTQGSSVPLQMDGSITAVTIDPVPAPVPAPAPALAPALVEAAAPGTPVITATSVGPRRVRVTWRAPDGNGGRAVTGYQLVSGRRTLTVGAGTLHATLTGLPGNRRLRVGVRARNAAGWGAPAYTAPVRTRR